MDRVEIFRNDTGIVVLQFLNISHLSVIPGRIYDFPKLKKWMCELSTFSQIRSHLTDNQKCVAMYFVYTGRIMIPYSGLLNQACAWFLRIASVCECVCLYVCVCVHPQGY